MFLVGYFDLGSFLVCLSISHTLVSYLCFNCVSIRYQHSSEEEELNWSLKEPESEQKRQICRVVVLAAKLECATPSSSVGQTEKSQFQQNDHARAHDLTLEHGPCSSVQPQARAQTRNKEHKILAQWSTLERNIACSSVAAINQESLFFEAISWEKILGHI